MDRDGVTSRADTHQSLEVQEIFAEEPFRIVHLGEKKVFAKHDKRTKLRCEYTGTGFQSGRGHRVGGNKKATR